MTNGDLLRALADDESVSVQQLRNAIVKATLTKRKTTRVTFETDAVTPTDFIGKPQTIGIIVWIPVEACERILGVKP